MDFNKYEKARIIGARALQIAMNAPILTDRENELNPIEIAKKEFREDILPLSVKRESPKKIERTKKLKKEEAPAEVPAEEAVEEKRELPEAEAVSDEGEEDKSKED